MHQACKVLRIEFKDLEPIFYNDFLKKRHDELYDLVGGQKIIDKIDVQKLAQSEYDHYEKRRQEKINTIIQYLKAKQLRKHRDTAIRLEIKKSQSPKRALSAL